MFRKRKNLRLPDFDYSTEGTYFVTICVEERKSLFGEIVQGEMQLNDVGQMVHTIWTQLPEHYPGVQIGELIVMPNHIHGIIVLASDVGAAPCGRPEDPAVFQSHGSSTNAGQPRGVAPTTVSLPDVVHRFKSLTTTRYRHGVRAKDWPPFPGRLWQRNYYEHVIRGEDELFQIRRYIQENPLKWDLDPENPKQMVPSI